MSPPPAARTSIPSPLRRRISIGLALVAVLATGTLLLLLRSRPPLLPIPAPPGLATLDPQVRHHLAGLAQAAAQAPQDPAPRTELGLAFAANALWIEARRCFLDAIQLGEPNPLAAMYASMALHEQGDLAGAASELRSLTRRFPDFAPAWHRLGTVLAAAGELPEAALAFETVTRLAPDEWRGWAGLGEIQLRSGRGTNAIDSLRRAIALDPFARSARHLLAQACQATGQTNEAARQFAAGRAQSVGPMPDAWSLQALGHMKSLPDQFERQDTLLAEGRTTEAIAQMRDALRFHPTNTAVFCRLAKALGAADQARVAWQLLEPALASQPGDLGLQITGADVAASLGLTNQALELAHRAIAQAPRSAEAQVAQANALLALGQDEAASAALARALERAPTDAGLRLQLGDLQWHNLQRPDLALDTYLRAHELDPIHPVVLHRLAELRLLRGETAEASRLITELRQLGARPEDLRDLEEKLPSVDPLPFP
jgi:tetratricopeptide (TPR) repeat protein